MVAAMAPLGAGAEQWRLHPTYDGNVERIIDTPDFTYFLSYCQKFMPSVSSNANIYLTLFRYDKQGDEVEALNCQNYLTENIIFKADYNPDKRYLFIAYENGNIDLLHDNGDVLNVPGFKLSSNDYSKVVKSVTFSKENNEVYVTTDFGYIVVDDESGEVLRSRFYDQGPNVVARFGDKVLIGCDDGLYIDDVASHASLGEMQRQAGVGKVRKMLANGDRLFVLSGEGYGAHLSYFDMNGGNLRYNDWMVTNFVDFSRGKDNMLIVGPEDIWVSDNDLNLTSYKLEPGDVMRTISGWTGNEFWFDNQREGLSRKKVSKDDAGVSSWTVTKQGMMPNASNAFRSDNIIYHKDYGMLVRNHGITPVLSNYDEQAPDMLCSYRNGEWSPRSATYLAPSEAFVQWNPGGIAVDPNNSNWVYSGSVFHGLMRLDLANPAESLRLGRQGDAGNGKKGFAAIRPDFKSWDAICLFSAPSFDSYGNLWSASYDRDKSQAKANNLEFWYWTPEDRAASRDAASLVAPKCLNIPSMSNGTGQMLVALRGNAAKNYLLYANGGWGGGLMLYDHKGTLANQGDDEMLEVKTFTDQDGALVDCAYIKTIREDLSTGRVWVGTDMGVFYFTPADFARTGGQVYRIKVARNDGTNLADYLLDGIGVNSITTDNAGRRWFGTAGGGIVITSDDGREILKTYTSDNSELPDNNVYAICYNPENNSMMISTDKGLAELFLSTNASGSAGGSDVKAYPNPVRPDYYGYVTIEGLADNALVKIVDAGGNLVKEVGFAAGGEIRWDVTNLNNKRVPGGVYYVLASGAPDGEGFSAKTKILVVN